MDAHILDDEAVMKFLAVGGLIAGLAVAGTPLHGAVAAGAAAAGLAVSDFMTMSVCLDGQGVVLALPPTSAFNKRSIAA